MTFPPLCSVPDLLSAWMTGPLPHAQVMLVCLYLLEAHFVERDEQGSVTDGWPIGYTEFEYAQHRTLADRQAMVGLGLL